MSMNKIPCTRRSDSPSRRHMCIYIYIYAHACMHVGMHANTLEQCYIFECMCSCNYKFSFYHPSPHAPRVAIACDPRVRLKHQSRVRRRIKDVDIVRKTK